VEEIRSLEKVRRENLKRGSDHLTVTIAKRKEEERRQTAGLKKKKREHSETLPFERRGGRKKSRGQFRRSARVIPTHKRYRWSVRLGVRGGGDVWSHLEKGLKGQTGMPETVTNEVSNQIHPRKGTLVLVVMGVRWL